MSTLDGAEIYRRAENLAQFSSDGPNRLTRLYLTPQHKEAALCIGRWMGEAGMAVAFDALGTVVGRYEGNSATARTLLIGSHIDTVRNAGKYDGALGVIVAIQAVQALARKGLRLPFAIEVLAFGDEEGVRFPVTLNASRAVAGTFDRAALEVRDADGISLRQALVDFGCDPDSIAGIARQAERVCGYLEVHIEQGPVLEAHNRPVGVVTAISGATRLKVSVTGFAGHAGTVPMNLRRDAGIAAAEMLLAIERIARQAGNAVATVGRMNFEPGAVNVIPSCAQFTVDLRSPDDALRRATLSRLNEDLAAIAKRRDCTLQLERFYDENAASCDVELIAQLDRSVRAHGIDPLHLPSGAGHDGLAMAALCPFAMLFVRCKGGISHNPAEAIVAEDAGIACSVLTHFLQEGVLS